MSALGIASYIIELMKCSVSSLNCFPVAGRGECVEMSDAFACPGSYWTENLYGCILSSHLCNLGVGLPLNDNSFQVAYGQLLL